MNNLNQDGTEDNELIELNVLLLKSDLEYINHLKNKNNVSQDELRALGLILIQSLRGFC